jgi:hypothetical protein
MPYIPQSRWRRRRRHQVERNEHNYDYFQDLRRVLDELEAAEAPVTAPAVDNSEPLAAETRAVMPAESHGQLDAAEVPAPTPSPDVSEPELADVEAPASTNDPPPTTQDLEASPPEVLETHRTTGPVPFGDLSRVLAELHAAQASTMKEVDRHTVDEPVPAPPAFPEGGPAEPAASVEPRVPLSATSEADAQSGSVTRKGSTPTGASSPWAEHMLLGALLVVAARRPIRRMLRIRRRLTRVDGSAGQMLPQGK